MSVLSKAGKSRNAESLRGAGQTARRLRLQISGRAIPIGQEASRGKIGRHGVTHLRGRSGATLIEAALQAKKESGLPHLQTAVNANKIIFRLARDSDIIQ